MVPDAATGAPGGRERRSPYARRRGALLGAAAVILAAMLYLALGTGGSAARRVHGAGARAARAASRAHAPGAAARAAPVSPTPPAPPHLAVSAPQLTGPGWMVVARVHGEPAAWESQRGGVTLLRFEQRLVHLNLHAGSLDGGTSGWVYGDSIGSREIHLVVAAINGGFKLSYANVGFLSAGHVAAPLRAGLASIVTYTDGTTAIGSWRHGVPSAHRAVFSVLQNQRLLVDGGAPAPTVSGCVISCWGETISSRTSVARSALAITASGQLLWAAGEQLEPAELAEAMVRAGAVRAVELDINPDWVAGYLYVHHPTGPAAVPVVPGQLGISGRFLEPYGRDFFTFVAN